jgi:hypothetical protein
MPEIQPTSFPIPEHPEWMPTPEEIVTRNALVCAYMEMLSHEPKTVIDHEGTT